MSTNNYTFGSAVTNSQIPDNTQNSAKTNERPTTKTSSKENNQCRAATSLNEETSYRVCPVCGAKTFTDMDTCYGCLHKFDSDADDNVDSNENSNAESLLNTAIDQEHFSSNHIPIEITLPSPLAEGSDSAKTDVLPGKRSSNETVPCIDDKTLLEVVITFKQATAVTAR